MVVSAVNGTTMREGGANFAGLAALFESGFLPIRPSLQLLVVEPVVFKTLAQPRIFGTQPRAFGRERLILSQDTVDVHRRLPAPEDGIHDLLGLAFALCGHSTELEPSKPAGPAANLLLVHR